MIFGKVRVADIMTTKRGSSASNRQKAFNRIAAKHFDFVLCNPKDLSVTAVIELDDKSHSRLSRQYRDQFLESACTAAGLTLHRFTAKRGYSVLEIRETIYPKASVATGRIEPVLRPPPIIGQKEIPILKNEV